ncbi:hypothetical protein GLOTRDRAFT_31249 [Gloeophyllum trabeum ATCC 11539]|uniref:Cytochrome b2 n=1 Tax=Gloeophyllum trabeum (strain ATCC 11539 / FP-39264 / Madison 617) TaxID=670483 RepID=S7S480_GLOTA|nr:uncharacterized protein GLOTRDRAFT_31249 [Gloeophyllum trabeum ATCC 11539]EPQ60684.1 hypothetical protein GLOTRDRAFT_31249 [Gloeophyllum trabeum ATCC 11539]
MYPYFTFESPSVLMHSVRRSCWVIIKNKVYDVTEFLPEHPGGSKIILKYAGRDATSAYEPIHPPDALDKNLPKEKHLGDLDTASAQQVAQASENKPKTKDELRIEQAQREKPPLSRVLSLLEMEDVARKVLSYKALMYYSSAADDEITYVENMRGFQRLFFHARVMRPVQTVDPSTTILGFKSSIPVFVSGAALAKLGHPLGEANITRGAGKTNIIQMVSSNASLSYEQIAQARIHPDQVLFFQLYKNKDDTLAEERVKEAERLGYKAIFLTVDAITPGNRERDIRAPYILEAQEAEAETKGGVEKPRTTAQVQEEEEEDGNINIMGTAGALIASVDQNMSWEKDAVLAAEAGVDGILISNHGGISLPSIDVLYRLRKQRPDVFGKCEVYVDGGARRGTDVLKALCLGAKAVGMGRPFLYAQSAYGEAGVVKAVRILEREIVTAMKLVGASSVKQLVPEMVEKVDWQPYYPPAKL